MAYATVTLSRFSRHVIPPRWPLRRGKCCANIDCLPRCATLSPRCSPAAATLETRCASLCIGSVTLEPRCASLAPRCDQCAASHGWPNYYWCTSHTVTFWPPRLATLQNVAQRGYNVWKRGTTLLKRDKAWQNVNWKYEFWACSKFSYVPTTWQQRDNCVVQRGNNVARTWQECVRT
jgi:hypothetical protein